MKKILFTLCAACIATSVYCIKYASNEKNVISIEQQATTEEVVYTSKQETEPTAEVIEVTKAAEATEAETEPPVNQEDLEMMACVIYQEAGGNGSCDECRYRVADVVLNRVADPRFPNTIKEVLTAKQQYGRFYWTGIVWPDRASNEGEKEAVARAYKVAEDVLTDKRHSDLYGNGYIWQAEFVQGKDNVHCCGIYFGR